MIFRIYQKRSSSIVGWFSRYRVWRQWLGLWILISGLTACYDDARPVTVEPKPIRPVKTMVVSSVKTTPVVTQVGDIEAYQQTVLGFRIAGRVLERRFDVGDLVHQGAILATLDPSNANNALKQANAELDNAKSAATLARRTLARMEKLLPNGAISHSRYDEAKSDWQAAASQLKRAQAAVKDAQDNLQFTHLIAPQDGVINETNANPGQVVSAGQQVFKLADNGQLDAVFEVPEQVLQTRIEDPQITVSLLSNPEIKTRAKLRDITPQADPYTRTYRVRVTLIDPPALMGLGAIVKGQLQLPTIDQVIVPKAALTRQGDQPAVYVVDRQSSELRLKLISVTRYSDDALYVSSGLDAGDQVVIAGVNQLRPGLKVRLMQGE
ncbi:efflux RND transporter periplasmic adaptor subunit [Vibrio gazogenes]|uniref:RND family efflux transporter, MFP subunit n=1 Tax=Vibrio gazogenes DSM 21264 = NBRC 103151 TaxID=1123492 RepID=A0A1M4TRR3_VIBGA|nr:efflux RND transporter periplasmic adaptor subunit [Vibrio gazogenes]USP16150.1 efflux RND transporter periplasmic adaptor subunit [Vibrio gazogenes]SHE46987.1 RND family efflux transporter, MFP subunit [Vibrio gazogenes DSM 21264] [Vibrio gazogenes DSM 21264 = NBRC 103151]SJN53007.1 Multidrug resistance protein MdtE precursor [Vibrio gazogenes]